MKNKISLVRFSVVILTLSIITSCGDEMTYFPDVQYASGAYVKFLHAASDASAVTFSVNDANVLAPQAPVPFAAFFPVTNYAQMNEGVSGLSIVIPATNTIPASTLLTSEFTTQVNQHYTVALAGVQNAYQAVLIDDDLSAVSLDGRSYVRFVNLIHNAPALNVVASITVGGVTTNTIIAKDVAFRSATTFMALNPGDYTITLRNAATDAVVATASSTNKLLLANRTYTFFARGQMGQTGTKIPTLDRLINQ